MSVSNIVTPNIGGIMQILSNKLDSFLFDVNISHPFLHSYVASLQNFDIENYHVDATTKFNTNITISIPKKGDLITSLYVILTLPSASIDYKYKNEIIDINKNYNSDLLEYRYYTFQFNTDNVNMLYNSLYEYQNNLVINNNIVNIKTNLYSLFPVSIYNNNFKIFVPLLAFVGSINYSSNILTNYNSVYISNNKLLFDINDSNIINDYQYYFTNLNSPLTQYNIVNYKFLKLLISLYCLNNDVYGGTNGTNKITNIYEVNKQITQNINNLVMYNNEFSIYNELNFIFYFYNLQSNNISNIPNNYKTIFFQNIRIGTINYNQPLIFVFIDKSNITNQSPLKCVLLVNNVIYNTINTSLYISNFQELTTNNNIYYCSTSLSQSIINITNLDRIRLFNANTEFNIFTIQISVVNTYNLGNLIFIYKQSKFIVVPNINSNVITINNIYYNIPVAIGIITQLNTITVNTPNDTLEITLVNINNNINDLSIGDIISVNLPNETNLSLDTITDIISNTVNYDTFNAYSFIYNNLINTRISSQELKNIIHVYSYESITDPLITVQYDNLLNCIQHNILYLNNIFNTIYKDNSDLNGRIIGFKSTFLNTNSVYSILSKIVYNTNLDLKFKNTYYISNSQTTFFVNGVNNYYNVYLDYINTNINTFITRFTNMYNNIMNICTSAGFDNNYFVNILLTFNQDDIYEFIMSSSQINISSGIFVFYDTINNIIVTDDLGNVVKLTPVIVDTVIYFKFTKFYTLTIDSSYTLVRINNNNILIDVPNPSNTIVTVNTPVNLKIYNYTDTYPVAIANINFVLLHFLIFIINKLLIFNKDLNSTDSIELNDTSIPLNIRIRKVNYFIQYLQSSLLELYTLIKYHLIAITNYYISNDNSPNVTVNEYDIIFANDINNILCPNQLFEYIIEVFYKYIKIHILTGITNILDGKTIYVNVNNSVVQVQLIKQPYININIYNLQYLLDTNDVFTIIIYYYSYLIIDNNNFNLLLTTNIDNFKYNLFNQYTGSSLDAQYIILYQNLIQSITSIIIFQDITIPNIGNIIITDKPINSNSPLYYIDDLSDSKLLYYYETFVQNLYSNYEYYDIIQNMNIINDNYYALLQSLLDAYNIGSTIGGIVNYVNTANEFNIDNIINSTNIIVSDNRFIINKNGNNSDLMYDKHLSSISSIVNTITYIYDDVTTSINNYTVNRDVLHINYLTIDNTINVYDIDAYKTFLLNKMINQTNNFYNSDYSIYNVNSVLPNNFIMPIVITTIIDDIININSDTIDNMNISINDFVTNNINDYYNLYTITNSIIDYSINTEDFITLSNLNYLIDINNLTYGGLYNFLNGDYNDVLYYTVVSYLYINFKNTLVYESNKNIYLKYYYQQNIKFQQLLNIFIDKLNNSINLNIFEKTLHDNINSPNINLPKYILILPINDNQINNKLLLVPVLIDKFLLSVHYDYNFYVNNTLANPLQKYSNDELNKKIKLGSENVSIVLKILDDYEYLLNATLSTKITLTNIRIHEKVILKYLLTQINNNSFTMNSLINTTINYKNQSYTLFGSMTTQLIINTVIYRMYDYHIVENNENIFDSKTFKIINNIPYRIHKLIKHYYYDFTNNLILYDYYYDDDFINIYNSVYAIFDMLSNITSTNNILNTDVTFLINNMSDDVLDKINYDTFIYLFVNKNDNINSFNQNLATVMVLNNIDDKLNDINATNNEYYMYLITNIEDIDYSLFENKNNIENKLFINNEITTSVITNYMRNNLNIMNQRDALNVTIYNKMKNRDNNVIPQFKWINNIGYFILNNTQLKFNDNTIEDVSDNWIYIWNNIFSHDNNNHKKGLNKMIGNTKENINFSKEKSSSNLYIKIPFFFNKNKMIPLPLIALYHTNVYISLYIKSLKELYEMNVEDDLTFNIINKIDVKLLIDYVSLGSIEEKKMFSNKKIDWLIETVQYEKHNITNTNTIITNEGERIADIKLNFKNSVKDMYWFICKHKQLHNYTETLYYDNIFNEYYNHDYVNKIIDNRITELIQYVNIDVDTLYPCNIDSSYIQSLLTYTQYKSIINYDVNLIKNKNTVKSTVFKCFGHNRFNELDGKITNLVLPKIYYKTNMIDGVNCYNFGLYQNIYNPSGSFNFSQIDLPRLLIKLNDNVANVDFNEIVYVIARSYNILRIMSGMGTLLIK